MNEELKEAYDQLTPVLGKLESVFIDGMRKHFKVSEDWVYRSGYTSRQAYNDMIDILGEENYLFITGHERFDLKTNESIAMRFSIFISPQGINKLKEYMTKKK